jgi:hypothetical protein
MRSFGKAYAIISNEHTAHWRTSTLWALLADWQYHKLLAEGKVYTCEEEGDVPFSLQTCNRKIEWYSYLLMRMQENG